MTCGLRGWREDGPPPWTLQLRDSAKVAEEPAGWNAHDVLGLWAPHDARLGNATKAKLAGSQGPSRQLPLWPALALPRALCLSSSEPDPAFF